MNTDKESIIARLRKLFALGQSSNQHEAELAMAKANEIMTEHQIGMTEIDMAEEGEIGHEDEIMEEGRAHVKFILTLANAAARMYDGQALRLVQSGGIRLRFVGTPTDVLAAKMTFKYLYASWKAIVKIDLSKAQKKAEDSMFFPLVDVKVFKRSHLRGYASAISRRVTELVASRKDKVAAAAGRDLVVVKNALVVDYVNGKMKPKNEKPPSGEFDKQAFEAGKQRGNDIPLNGAIEENIEAAKKS